MNIIVEFQSREHPGVEGYRISLSLVIMERIAARA